MGPDILRISWCTLVAARDCVGANPAFKPSPSRGGLGGDGVESKSFRSCERVTSLLVQRSHQETPFRALRLCSLNVHPWPCSERRTSCAPLRMMLRKCQSVIFANRFCLLTSFPRTRESSDFAPALPLMRKTLLASTTKGTHLVRLEPN